jgi:tetratricopeptide (TPR) repeat protein
VVPITRTCSLAALLLCCAGAASARIDLGRPSGPTTFVGARAAELTGDPRRAALLYAALAASEPGNQLVADRAISQAIAAGDLRLALQLTGRRSPASLPVDARLLLAADRLKNGKERDAVAILRLRGGGAELDFLAPFVEAWSERRISAALGRLNSVAAASATAAYVPEHRALLLLRARRIAEAEPFVTQALRVGGGRETRLRLAFADAYHRAGDRARAARMLGTRDVALDHARRQLAKGAAPGAGVTTPAEAFAELLTALAIDLQRAEIGGLPIAAMQVARHAAPQSPTAPVLLGILLAEADRLDDALAVLRTVEDGAPFGSQARDAEVRALTRATRLEEALARARAFVASGTTNANDWSRLGDVLDEMGRSGEAADAFGRAVALVEAGGSGPDLWQLHLLRGAMLEESDRWPQAKASLEAARRLAPRNPMVLNYLGYAQLERGENLDGAEALIAEAHRLAPDDASITDSLGWAQFKRGRQQEAIATLQRAAAADPSETEIHEHLGDALYTVGRKFEARHAWQAALLTAEDDVKTRIEGKLGAGLNAANAAP